VPELKDFLLSSYDYELPPELIAQEPPELRHHARLMLVGENQKEDDQIEDMRVWDMKNKLRKGDLVVLNDTRVLKARLRVRLSGGGQAELLVLEPLEGGLWLCLAKPAKRMRPGDRLFLECRGEESVELKVVDKEVASGGRIIQFPSIFSDRQKIEILLNRYGEVPLPPYIKNLSSSDSNRYQTRFAVNPGAVAAPTAGLHLSDELLRELRRNGISQATITLHVGLGTFRPLEKDDLTNLLLHSEWVEVKPEVIKAIEECRTRGGRVIAVGTTCVRALEGAFQVGGGVLSPLSEKVDLVIKPGYKFGVVDGLLTNFHLPRSSLLLLVSAFIGRERLLTLYKKAIKSQFRFFSYGDAMLIMPEAVLTSARVKKV
tara:strand:+ start:9846 stop:10964 length:1119 start_codon:yes stop_codon:yes gene_type:complete